MAIPVIMPRQGQSVETCVITQWNKQVGDEVKKGDVLFSYETDKASFEEEAKADGQLLAIFYNEGDEPPVLTNVAVLGKAGENIEEFRAGKTAAAPVADGQKPAAHVAEPVSQSAPVPERAETEPITGEIKISPRAKHLAEKLGVPVSKLQGSGPEGRVIERDVEVYAKSGALMTPLAAEMAADKNLQPGTASGLGGRTLSFDLVETANIYSEDSEVKKLSNMRKIIAKAMFESIQNSAQLTHHMGADVRKLLDFRKKVKAAMDKGSTDNITLNDMVCYAVIKALKKNPEANAHFLGDSIRTFNKVHLGIAVDTPRGLMVPVVRNADDLSLKGLSSQLKAIADSCKKGNVNPELLASTAASFTVSNLGNYGVELFTPIINLPQVAILGVNTIVNRPADLGNGVFGFVPYMGLSLTYDHRAIDGGPATLFLREIKMQIENWNETL